MNSTNNSNGGTLLGAPACFIFDSDSNPIDGLKLCIAGERVSGKGTIVGAQKMGKIFRIYPKTNTAREALIIHGIEYNSTHLPVLTNNPFVDTGKTSVRAIIGNVPLSVSNTEIFDSFSSIEGVKTRSKLFYEGYRNEDKTLTSFKTGRRFIYIDTPKKPLPRFFQVGSWKATLYHYGQKEKSIPENSSDDIMPSLDNNACNETSPVVDLQTCIDKETDDTQTTAKKLDGKTQINNDKVFSVFADSVRGRSDIRLSRSNSVGSFANRETNRSSSRRKRDSPSPDSKRKARKIVPQTVPNSVKGEGVKGNLLKQTVNTQPKSVSSKNNASKGDS